MTDPLFVGVDAGGTKTAALAEAGARRETFSGPGAQAARDGAAAAAAALADVIAWARDAFPDVPLAGVAVGLAGAGRPDVCTAIADALGLDAPLVVTHDADIAYRAAWGDEGGAVLLVGTGSLVLARTDAGETLRAGGWGPALGDDGSGAALGRHALRALLAALDGGPPSALPAIAAEHHGLATSADVVAAVYDDARPLSTFAPLLLAAVEAGDWAAETALRAETNALAKQAGWLATRAGDTVRTRLAVSGGLAGEPVYWTALADALARHLPGWAVSKCEAEPVEGALALARTLAD
ncbi:BadF/BadG/BcrA/BcrD ATPase family protein [Rubrivirga sp. IMCC45206]|uniref:BadF/BadG/BcrA/BcrD ATPase family protein n=1 Tax=Rubrivirga sp. IMCC45206 TaxID=3391614 RepID=UPI00398FD800